MKEIKRGQLYYADLWPVIGSEQGGVRPVLILQNDVGNKYSPTTIVAALTSRKTKLIFPTHVTILAQELKQRSIVLLEQIRTIDKTRLGVYIGQADEQTMRDVEQALAISLGFEHLEGICNGKGQNS